MALTLKCATSHSGSLCLTPSQQTLLLLVQSSLTANTCVLSSMHRRNPKRFPAPPHQLLETDLFLAQPNTPSHPYYQSLPLSTSPACTVLVHTMNSCGRPSRPATSANWQFAVPSSGCTTLSVKSFSAALTRHARAHPQAGRGRAVGH